jgi:hypothetical protein
LNMAVIHHPGITSFTYMSTSGDQLIPPADQPRTPELHVK